MRENSLLPQVLVIDKKGFIGQELVKLLLKDFEVIYVSEPVYKKRFPEIPNISYTQIIVIYNGEKEVKEVFGELIKAAEDIKARIIFAIPLSLSNKKSIQEIVSAYGRAYVVIFGEVFSKHLILNSLVPQIYKNSNTAKLLLQVNNDGRILVPYDGMEKVYPVFLEDAIWGIREVIFKSHSLRRIFCLFPKHPLTTLSIALMMKRIEPLIKVDFDFGRKDKVNKVTENIPDNAEYIESGVSLQKRFAEVLHPGPSVSPRASKSRTTKYITLLKAGIISIIIALFMPFVLTLIFTFLGGYSLNVSKQAIENGNFSSSLKSAHRGRSFFQWARGFSKIIFFEPKFISDIIAKGDELSAASVSLNESLKYFTEFLVSSTPVNEKDFRYAHASLMHALAAFQKLKAEEGEEFFNNSSFDLLSTFTSSALEITPNILGLEKNPPAGGKKYLVLFQNNMELRPGGGFIGSYGLLTLKKGKITDFSIHDVYDADGKLKGHIEPPYPIRRYLPSVHWYLRDSNFDIDFTKNASKAAFFLNNETGESVDGVIGVDISFMKELLKASGPIYVADYNETVSSDNLYLLTQTHAEKNFFPGSTQKKDFLRSLFNALSLYMKAGDNKSSKRGELYFQLLEAVTRSVSQKHLIFAFSDPDIQNLFTTYNMSSSIFDPRKSEINTINDYLGISEANIGINKANYFIRRKVGQLITISEDGEISGKVTIAYKNLSTKNSWPGGDYKNYLRIILPLNSQVSLITFDKEEQKITPAITDPVIYEAKNFSPPKGLEVETAEEEGKTVVGFLVVVPKEALKTITIQYTLPQKISIEKTSFTYDLLYFKQPGTDEYPFSFTLSYPKSFKILSLSENLKESREKINFSTTITKDTSIKINFSKP